MAIPLAMTRWRKGVLVKQWVCLKIREKPPKSHGMSSIITIMIIIISAITIIVIF